MPCLRGGKDEIALHRLSIFEQNLIDPTKGEVAWLKSVPANVYRLEKKKVLETFVVTARICAAGVKSCGEGASAHRGKTPKHLRTRREQFRM